MIEATGRLMREKGFHATGLNQIVAEAGAPKGSMYFHFPGGKVELAAAALDTFADAVTRYLERLVDEHESTSEAVVAFIESTARRMERTGFRSGCVIATVALEAAAQEPALGDVCAAALERWSTVLADGLVSEGWSRPMPAIVPSSWCSRSRVPSSDRRHDATSRRSGTWRARSSRC